MNRYSRITGTGSFLPPRRLTNAELATQLAFQGVETSDEWIVERTGIRARHFVDDGVFSSDLALEACTSKAAPPLAPSLFCKMQAVDGKTMSGVDVATIIRSIS